MCHFKGVLRNSIVPMSFFLSGDLNSSSPRLLLRSASSSVTVFDKFSSSVTIRFSIVTPCSSWTSSSGTTLFLSRGARFSALISASVCLTFGWTLELRHISTKVTRATKTIGIVTPSAMARVLFVDSVELSCGWKRPELSSGSGRGGEGGEQVLLTNTVPRLLIKLVELVPRNPIRGSFDAKRNYRLTVGFDDPPLRMLRPVFVVNSSVRMPN